MSDQRDPYPYLSRVPAGPTRESLRLLWNQFTQIKGAFPPGFFTPPNPTDAGSGSGGTGGVILTSANADRLQVFAGQTIPNSVLTALTWLQDQAVVQGVDARELFVVGATPTRFNIPRRFGAGGLNTPSVWLVNIDVTWDVNATGYRQLVVNAVLPSGTQTLANVSHPAATGQTTGQSATGILLNPPGGSYIEASVQQNSGGGVILSATGSMVQMF